MDLPVEICTTILCPVSDWLSVTSESAKMSSQTPLSPTIIDQRHIWDITTVTGSGSCLLRAAVLLVCSLDGETSLRI